MLLTMWQRNLKNMVLLLWSWKMLSLKCCRVDASAIVCLVWSSTRSSEILIVEFFPVPDTETTPIFSSINSTVHQTVLKMWYILGYSKLAQSCCVFPSGDSIHSLVCSDYSAMSSWRTPKPTHLFCICHGLMDTRRKLSQLSWCVVSFYPQVTPQM